MALHNIRPLAGYITLAEAADRIGVSKQMVHKMIENEDIKSCRKVGDRPVFVVSEKEIEKVIDARNSPAVLDSPERELATAS